MKMPLHPGDYAAYQKGNPFMDHNHIEIVTAGTEKSVLQVHLVPESMNLRGAVHGGLLYALADCTAGLTARSDGGDYVTQSSHLNFLRNTDSGTLTCEGTPVKRGRQMTIIHVAVRDQNGRLLADGVMDMIRVQVSS